MATIRKRGKGWRAEVCVHKRRDARTFDTQTEAAAWAARTETEMRNGTYIDLKAAKKITLADLLHRFQTEVTPTRRTARTARAECEKIDFLMRQPISSYPVGTITSDDVKRHISERSKTVSDSTINREIAIFRRVINLAISDWGIALPRNVFKGAKQEKLALDGDDENEIDNDETDNEVFYEGRQRIPTATEITNLTRELSACDNRLMLPAFQLAIETGLRKSELLGLKWSDVNFKTCELQVRRVADLNKKTMNGTKNGTSGKIPLSQTAIDVLKALFRPTVRIFAGLAYDGVSMAWKRAKVRAGVIDLRWHDLRHAAITNAAKAFNGDLFKTKQFSRHKSTAMVIRYVNHRTEELVTDLNKKQHNVTQ
jgi:integrase